MSKDVKFERTISWDNQLTVKASWGDSEVTVVTAGDQEGQNENLEEEFLKMEKDALYKLGLAALELPLELIKLDSVQQLAVIEHLSRKPFKFLRWMQDIVAKQTPYAYARRDDIALANLQIKAVHLAAAVDQKEFAEKRRRTAGHAEFGEKVHQLFAAHYGYPKEEDSE